MSIVSGTSGNDDLNLAQAGAQYIEVKGSEGNDVFRLDGLDEASAVYLRYSSDDRFADGTAMMIDLAADSGMVRKFGVGTDRLTGVRNLFQQSAGGWFDLAGSDGDDNFTFNSHGEDGDLHFGQAWMIATTGQDVVNLTGYAGRFQINYNTIGVDGVLIDLRRGIVDKGPPPLFFPGLPEEDQHDVLMLPRGAEAGLLTLAFFAPHGDDSVFGADDGYQLVLRLGGGRDVFVGGAGHYTLEYRSATLSQRVTGLDVDMAMGMATGEWNGVAFRHIFSGVDSIRGSVNDDIVAGSRLGDALSGSLGDDSIAGRAGNDDLRGDEGNDTLNGGSGHDVLAGGDGADSLQGGKGDDTLAGGLGRDRLQGSQGADVFVFRSAAEAGLGTGRDIVRDFQPGLDRIDMSAIAPDLVFVGTAAFSRTAGEIRQVGANGRLQGDLDGDGLADFEIALSNGALIGAQDLIL